MTDEIHIYNSQSHKAESGQPKSSFTTYILWLISSILSILVLGYFSAFVPGRFKLLGLFACSLGLMSSGLILYWKNMWSMNHIQSLKTVSFVFAIICFAWSTYHSFQKFKSNLNQQLSVQNSSLVPLNKNQAKIIQTEEDRTDKEVRQSIRKMLDSMKQDTTFPAYLRYRVSSIGNWSSPWPMIFWLTELLLAGVTSCLFTGRFLTKGIPIPNHVE